MNEPKFGTWTPTSEQLPERLKWVLATVKGTKKPRILCQHTERGLTYWHETNATIEYREVTAWMPLPEPYREAGEVE